MSQNAEWKLVECPLIKQLQTMGWDYKKGNMYYPLKTERRSWLDVLLEEKIKTALKKLNQADGKDWLDDARIDQALDQLKRIQSQDLAKANAEAFELILGGATVAGDPQIHGGRNTRIKFIDFEDWQKNDFLAINQFRVDIPNMAKSIIPDIVLFVNGIPLVVIECKSPNSTNQSTDPIEEGIEQLFRYMNRTEAKEGNENLFHYNQIVISTCLDDARMASVTSTEDWFCLWNDTFPKTELEVEQEVSVPKLSQQHKLVAGMLRPQNLLDIIRNFIVFSSSSGMKMISQYHQYRAVQNAIVRLRTYQTLKQHGQADQRGGIIWHTPGSGKSIEMAFLVKKMRTYPDLKKFKILALVDDKDLEEQLKPTLQQSNDVLISAKNSKHMQEMLQDDSPMTVLSLTQKYYNQDEEQTQQQLKNETFPTLNESENILILVDEAHRRHTGIYHANLAKSLPNCAKIGFTGTPIVSHTSTKHLSHEIFGEYIDTYTITQSEEDEVTVPILYEGRFASLTLKGAETLDAMFAGLFPNYSKEEIEEIKRKYATPQAVLEAVEVIRAKADDMLQHYITHILPDGFKAQVVAISRLAAVRYKIEFENSLNELLEKIANLPATHYTQEELEQLDKEKRYLVVAKEHEDILKRLEFAAIISGAQNDPLANQVNNLDDYTDPDKQDERIERVKKPLTHVDPTKQDGLAFIIVKSMLITGFDSPQEQVLYLDRKMRGAELLQTISRVNRKKTGKLAGYVVDYAGVDPKEALKEYDSLDIKGSIRSVEELLPLLERSHDEAVKIFTAEGLDINDSTECVHLLEDMKIRVHFHNKFKIFGGFMTAVLPHPGALPYVRDLQKLGAICVRAWRLYRDNVLKRSIRSAGAQVRKLIDDHVTASGIDAKVPPISITDPNFESMVTQTQSNKTKALEMEHAIRSYITENELKDPIFYKKISEKLEEIIQTIKDEREQLDALRGLVIQTQQGRQKDATGLDPDKEAPFYDLIIDGKGSDVSDEDEMKKYVAKTLEIIKIIKDDISNKDFWLNSYLQSVLQSKIAKLLDDNNLVPFKKCETTSENLLNITSSIYNHA